MKIIIPFLVSIFLLPSLALATVITVCSSGCDYTAIQAGINAAADNDEVSIKDSGDYNESVVVNRSIILTSTADPAPLIWNNWTSTVTSSVINVTANNAIVRNLTVKHNGTLLVYGITAWLTNNVTLQNITNVNITSPNAAGAREAVGIHLFKTNATTLVNVNVSSINNTVSGVASHVYSVFVNNSNYTNISTSTFNNNLLSTNAGGPNNFGIYLRNSNFTTIYNTNVTGTTTKVAASAWSSNIYLFNSHNTTMINVRADSLSATNVNVAGIYIDSSLNTTITNSSASDNVGTHSNGISRGIHITSSHNTTISNSKINDNRVTGTGTPDAYGIYISNSNSLTIENSNVSGAKNTDTSSGTDVVNIYLTGSNNATIRNVTANSVDGGSSSDIEAGIYLTNSQNATITNVTVNSNEFYGIYFASGATNNTVTNSTISGNTNTDIYFSSAAVFNNTINTTAVLWVPSLTQANNAVIENISLTGNGNTNYGKLTIANANNVTVRNVNITGNTSSAGQTRGIYLFSTNATTLVNVNVSSINGTSTSSPYVYGLYAESSNYTNISASNFNNNSIVPSGCCTQSSAYGIYMLNSNFTTIENSNVSGTKRGTISGGGTLPIAINILLRESHNTTIKNSRANAVNSDVTSTVGNNVGIYINRSHNSTIVGSEASYGVNNIPTGIIVAYSNNAVIINSTVINNRMTTSPGFATDVYGIYMLNSNFTTIENSNVSGTTNTGSFGGSDVANIFLSNSHNATIRNVTANFVDGASSSDIEAGIYLTNSQNATITNVTVNSNEFYGIYLGGNSRYNLINSTVITTSIASTQGIRIDNSHNNTIQNTSISTSGTTGYGIQLLTGSQNNTVQGSNITTSSTTNSHAIYLLNASNNVVKDSFINTSVTGTSNDIRSDSNSTPTMSGINYIVNSSFNRSDISMARSNNGSVLVQWYLDVRTVDSTNSAINGATVFGNDSNAVGNSENPANNFSDTTNSSGYIVRQILSESISNRTQDPSVNRSVFFNNHTINASATSYNANSTAINLTASTTITFTMFTSGVEDRKVISKDNAYEILYNDSSAQIIGRINNNDITASISSGWHHVALVYDKDGGDNNLNLYVDGVLATSSTLTGAITANTNEIEIGKNFTNGIVDEVKLWRRALTAAEIDFEYDASIKKITTSREIPTISPSTTGTVNTTIVLASPGSNFFDDVIVKSGPKKLRFVVPYQNIDIVNQSRFGPGDHNIIIRHYGTNTTSNRPMIGLEE